MSEIELPEMKELDEKKKKWEQEYESECEEKIRGIIFKHFGDWPEMVVVTETRSDMEWVRHGMDCSIEKIIKVVKAEIIKGIDLGLNCNFGYSYNLIYTPDGLFQCQSINFDKKQRKFGNCISTAVPIWPGKKTRVLNEKACCAPSCLNSSLVSYIDKQNEIKNGRTLEGLYDFGDIKFCI